MIRPRSMLHVWLLGLALLNTLPTIEAQDSWWLLAVAAVCAAVSLAVARPGRPSPVRPWMVTLGVLSAVVYAIDTMFLRPEETPVYILELGHFMILLCCCKFFELRSLRDAGIIVLMSFLLLVIAAFISASLMFAAVVVLNVTAGVVWLLEYQSRREADRIAVAAGPLRKAAHGSGEALKLTLPAAGLRSRLSAAAGCSLALAAVGFAVFVAVPRGWSTGLFGRMQRMVPTAVSGFTDDITLRDTAIFEDDTPVMRVRFTRAGQLLGGDGFRPLMRGGTLDRYVRGRWERTHTYAPARRNAQRGLSVEPLFNAGARYAAADLVEQDVMLYQSTRGNLFSLYPPVYFGSADLTFLQQDPIDLCLHTPRVPKANTRYLVYSLRPPTPAFNRRIEFAPRDQLRREEASVIPPRVVDLAYELCRDFGNPADPSQREAACRHIESHLAGGQYAYTLSRGRPPHGVDPVEDFLVSSRRGHCEYFASAMAVLCQAVNIPARLVSGFAGGEFDPETGAYEFRQKHAHAWVEVFLTDRGWTAFDPTPAADARDITQQAGLWARAMRLVDVLRAQWSSSVVLFDADRRGGLIGTFRDWFARLSAAERGRSTRSVVMDLLWGPEMIRPVERILYWCLLVLIAAFLILLLRVLWLTALIVRAYLPSPAGGGRQLTRRAEARFYDHLMALLENKGHARPAGQTPLEFARRLAVTHRDLAEVPGLVDLFYAVQFGQRSMPRDSARRLNAFLQRLREDPAFGTR